MPSRNLKIALFPLDIIPGDINANLSMLKCRIDNLEAETDLVVVPEMFSTGYIRDPESLGKLSKTDVGNTLTTLQKWADEKNLSIWGTLIAVENGSFYNRGFMLCPHGHPAFYDKHHLFSYGGEDKVFSAGQSPSPIVKFRSWNLKMAICYDLRFPVWNRSVANEYDALIVPANWTHSRFYPWRQLLIARAIENQTYTIGCNRTGNDLYGSYEPTDTLAFDCNGKETGSFAPDGTLYVELDADKLNIARSRFTPWRDADDFEILL